MELILILGFGITHKTKIPKLVLSKLDDSAGSKIAAEKENETANIAANAPESGSNGKEDLEDKKDNIEKPDCG